MTECNRTLTLRHQNRLKKQEGTLSNKI